MYPICIFQLLQFLIGNLEKMLEDHLPAINNWTTCHLLIWNWLHSSPWHFTAFFVFFNKANLQVLIKRCAMTQPVMMYSASSQIWQLCLSAKYILSTGIIRRALVFFWVFFQPLLFQHKPFSKCSNVFLSFTWKGKLCV